MPIPADRLTALNDVALDPTRDLVLYWCVMARRTTWNFALQHAVETARALGRPLVVLEALRVGYPWANARLHRFAIDGMADDAAAYARAGGGAPGVRGARGRRGGADCSRRSASERAWW
jgi:deoxyribodipyrimidine photo-lyase